MLQCFRDHFYNLRDCSSPSKVLRFVCKRILANTWLHFQVRDLENFQTTEAASKHGRKLPGTGDEPPEFGVGDTNAIIPQILAFQNFKHQLAGVTMRGEGTANNAAQYSLKHAISSQKFIFF